MSIKKMLDISKHQASFNAATAKANGISTVICRCAYGTVKDTKWDAFAPAVKNAGMALGAYGFMTAHYQSKNGGNFSQAQAVMKKQVQYWIELCKAKGCEMLAVDQELEAGNAMAFGKSANTTLLKEAASMIRAAGLYPVIYASASWVNSYIDWQSIDADFWIAYYPSSVAASDFGAYADGSFPSGQYGNLLRNTQEAGKLFAWQYGSTGNGIKYGAGSVNIDRNWQYKDFEEEEKPDMAFYSDTLKIGPVSSGDRQTMENLADTLGVSKQASGDYIIVGPTNEDNVQTIAAKALSLALGCVDYYTFKSEYVKVGPVSTGDRNTMKQFASDMKVNAVDDGDYLIIGPASNDVLSEVAVKAKSLNIGCVEYTPPDTPTDPEEPSAGGGVDINISGLTDKQEQFIRDVVVALVKMWGGTIE